MKKACSILKKPFAILCIALGLICLLGILAFSLSYNEETLNLELDSFISILFLALIIIAIASGIVYSVAIRKIRPAKMVTNSRVDLVCSAIAAATTLVLFLASVADISALSLPGKAQTILGLIACIYFVTEALGEKKDLVPYIGEDVFKRFLELSIIKFDS